MKKKLLFITSMFMLVCLMCGNVWAKSNVATKILERLPLIGSMFKEKQTTNNNNNSRISETIVETESVVETTETEEKTTTEEVIEDTADVIIDLSDENVIDLSSDFSYVQLTGEIGKEIKAGDVVRLKDSSEKVVSSIEEIDDNVFELELIDSKTVEKIEKVVEAVDTLSTLEPDEFEELLGTDDIVPEDDTELDETEEETQIVEVVETVVRKIEAEDKPKTYDTQYILKLMNKKLSAKDSIVIHHTDENGIETKQKIKADENDIFESLPYEEYTYIGKKQTQLGNINYHFNVYDTTNEYVTETIINEVVIRRGDPLWVEPETTQKRVIEETESTTTVVESEKEVQELEELSEKELNVAKAVGANAVVNDMQGDTSRIEEALESKTNPELDSIVNAIKEKEAKRYNLNDTSEESALEQQQINYFDYIKLSQEEMDTMMNNIFLGINSGMESNDYRTFMNSIESETCDNNIPCVSHVTKNPNNKELLLGHSVISWTGNHLNDFDMDVIGLSGATFDTAVKIADIINKKTYDTIYVCLGVNDILFGYKNVYPDSQFKLDKVKKDLDELYTKLSSTGAKIVFMNCDCNNISTEEAQMVNELNNYIGSNYDIFIIDRQPNIDKCHYRWETLRKQVKRMLSTYREEI